jgi:hypothetical protein
MPFKDPLIERPSDGQKVHFKVTGDTKIAEATEPSVGRFRHTHADHFEAIGYMGSFVDEKTGRHFHLWADKEYEVAAWRPYEEFLTELH